MQKKIRWLILIVALALAGCGRSAARRVQEQLALGQKYLTEENYEEAIIAFNKAIELDEKEIRAYTGLVQSYEAVGDIEKLLEILNQLLEIEPNNEEYQQSVQKYEHQIQEEEKYESFREENFEILEQLYEACSQENDEEIEKAMRSESFQFMKASFPDDTDRIYGQIISGKRLGIFCVRQDYNTEYYVYYGGAQEGMRSGEGNWYCAYTDIYGDGINAIGFFKYSGSWSNDLPNGEGACYQILSKEDGTLVTEWMTSGGYTDGKENGNMTKLISENWRTETFLYTCKDGIAPVLEDFDGDSDRVVIAYGENVSSNKLCLEEEDQVQGVEPFAIHSCSYSM